MYGNAQAFPSWRPFKLSIGGAHHEIPAPFGSNQRPILRGAQHGLENKHGSAIAQAYTDGLVEMCSMWFAQPRELIYITWVLSPIANALLMAENFRNAAGVPDVEYGLEVELYDSIATLISLGPFTQNLATEGPLGSPLDSPCILPRYSFGPLVEITPLIELVVRDLNDAVGTHAPKKPYVLSW